MSPVVLGYFSVTIPGSSDFWYGFWLLLTEHQLEMLTMKRHKWMKQENSEVLYCYYSSYPNERGYRARLYSLWRERNPDGAPFSEQRIVDQTLSLLHRGEFTAVELEELMQRVEGANTRFEDTSGTSPPSSLSPPQVQFVNSPNGTSFATDHTISSYNFNGACTFQDLTASQKRATI